MFSAPLLNCNIGARENIEKYSSKHFLRKDTPKELAITFDCMVSLKQGVDGHLLIRNLIRTLIEVSPKYFITIANDLRGVL